MNDVTNNKKEYAYKKLQVKNAYLYFFDYKEKLSEAVVAMWCYVFTSGIAIIELVLCFFDMPKYSLGWVMVKKSHNIFYIIQLNCWCCRINIFLCSFLAYADLLANSECCPAQKKKII